MWAAVDPSSRSSLFLLAWSEAMIMVSVGAESIWSTAASSTSSSAPNARVAAWNGIFM